MSRVRVKICSTLDNLGSIETTFNTVLKKGSNHFIGLKGVKDNIVLIYEIGNSKKEEKLK